MTTIGPDLKAMLTRDIQGAQSPADRAALLYEVAKLFFDRLPPLPEGADGATSASERTSIGAVVDAARTHYEAADAGQLD
ncbi:hypothetical protein BIV03_01060 [Curtobacterium sp. MCBA15_016]|uniref:hypothetical protein n=1 Tax=Curtobacterium sp. MCBA15_016 TaxID=1898740 RepID=UPI0008DE0377|nr:hypothetical protein [Curtobacterium sp. MCBA15_016]OII28870.1 hypothetical protein BIV03_01060 [Curtobacterium sp. MCBA15_016]